MELKNNTLTLNEGEEVLIKVASKQEFPGTDNTDIEPIELDYNKGATEGDSVFVNNITIQEKSGWCKCELIANGKAVKYTALEENPTDKPRTVYFQHKTTDEKLSYGGNAGKPTMKLWIVTVIQAANPNIKEDTPEPEDPSKLGKYKYSVGLLSDIHKCKANDNATPNDTSDDWGDEEDFKDCMEVFVNDQDIKFISSCGDIAESQTNDNINHPEATCDTDYKEFTEMYDVPYWQVTGLRFFSPLGNHDFYGIFESRAGDNIIGKKNTETTIGYNAGVFNRLSLWPTGQQINGIVPGRGRILFELENGKDSPIGQADMNFFSYTDYADLYAKKGGYNKDSLWDSNKGGISDQAIKLAKAYVNNNWNSVKDNLVMWNDGGSHGRNAYSKFNYWMKKDNDIFIYLSVDYGNDIWPINNEWHDRMIHARQIINLNIDDPYIKRMKEYVQDTGYSSADEPYNYQYYSPNTLIWLKEILENNTDKKIYIFSHHFMPNRVGNSNGIPQDGGYSYASISPAGELTSAGINKGSNTLTGIEFWFINKLMNLYKNVVWFTGHSHISWDVNANIDNHDYEIVSPSKQNAYTKASNTPKATSAWCIALPSMSKPRYLSKDGKSSRMYDDAELGIMEIYENGIKIKGYKVREKNKNVFNMNNPLVEKTSILI